MRTKLSLLWVFVLLNIIVKDIHDLFRPGLLKEMQDGIVNGNIITEELILIGGILFELPILMIILAQFLPQKLNKWSKIGVALVSALFLFSNPPKDLDDVFFLIVSTIGLLIIILICLKSREALNTTN
jgi:Sec-independent protein secretion pathway component TatC